MSVPVALEFVSVKVKVVLGFPCNFHYVHIYSTQILDALLRIRFSSSISTGIILEFTLYSQPPICFWILYRMSYLFECKVCDGDVVSNMSCESIQAFFNAFFCGKRERGSEIDWVKNK